MVHDLPRNIDGVVFPGMEATRIVHRQVDDPGTTRIEGGGLLMTGSRGLKDLPNRQEVTKTTLPLLATVLAGFAVSIDLQVVSIASIQTITSPNHRRLLIGLLCVMASIPLLIVAIVFAMWGQAASFEHLTEEVRELLGINKSVGELEGYLDDQDYRWWQWYSGAVRTFNLGIGLFTVGVGLLLWDLLGDIAAACYGVSLLISLGWFVVVWCKAHFVRPSAHARPPTRQQTNRDNHT